MVSLLSFRTFSCNNIKSKHCKQLNSIDWAQYSRINSIFGSLLRYYRLVMLFCYLFMSHTQTEYNMRYHSYISDVALFFSNFVLLIERVYVCMFFFACRKIHSWKMSKTNKKKSSTDGMKKVVPFDVFVPFTISRRIWEEILFSIRQMLHSDSISWMQFSMLFALDANVKRSSVFGFYLQMFNRMWISALDVRRRRRRRWKIEL